MKKNISLIIKLILFLLFALTFWGFDSNKISGIIIGLFSIFYLTINIIYYILVLKIKNNLIMNILIYVLDNLCLLYFIYNTFYFVKEIPTDGDEKFATLFSIFSIIGVVLFIIFNFLDYFIFNKNKS